MKNIIRSIIAALGFCFFAISAHAIPVTWNLNGVTFDDGGTASGWFIWDAATNTAGAFDISTTAGSTLGAATYNASNSYHYGSNVFLANDMLWLNTVVNRYIDLVFASLLTDAGGTVGIVTGGYGANGSWECNNCYPERTVTSGYVTADVPEPASLLLAGLALAGLGFTRKSRANKQA